MKIGIMTFHNVPNYGAALQAFALKTYLSELGHDVRLIDYQCPGNSDEFSPESLKSKSRRSGNVVKRIVKSLMYDVLVNKDYCCKYNKFKQFSDEFYNLEGYTSDIYNSFDIVFCGSDQIWNPAITKGFKPPYFGGQRDITKVAASYAASCGDVSELNENLRSELCTLVRNLDFAGVREKSLYDYLCAQGIECTYTLDPTFLLTASDYIEKLHLKMNNEKKYILQYSLRKSDDLDKAAAKVAKEKGLKIIDVCGYIPKKLHRGHFDIGPVEFLEYLYNAEYVVTNSFHGVALSLNFKKDFNVCLPVHRKGRIQDLLEMLDLTDRIYSHEKKMATDKIDYEGNSRKLNGSLETSKFFISKALEKV